MYTNHNSNRFAGLRGLNSGLSNGLLNGLHNTSMERAKIIAKGGEEFTITQNGVTYKVHVFKNTDLFFIEHCTDLSRFWVFMVAGGAGGGGSTSSNFIGGGGGGAGGYIENTSLQLGVGEWRAVVGAGGSRGVNTNGTAGSNTTFGGLTAIGGGFGTKIGNANAGGSGGGAGSLNLTYIGGAGTVGQGFKGGDVPNINSLCGGGGGGGTQAGVNANQTGSVGGKGGNGYTPTIPGILELALGVNGVFAGGGGGATGSATGTFGLGGTGGGGNSGQNTGVPTAQDGVANTGAGGGGMGRISSAGTTPAGAGGKGIIVIAYPI